MPSNIEILSYILILVLIIAVIVLPDVIKNNAMLANFLDDNINIGLLVIIIILVSELDKVVSVLLLLLIGLMLVMTRTRSKPAQPTVSPISGIPLNNYRTDILKISRDQLNTMARGGQQQLQNMFLKESFVRDRVPVYPNRGVMGTPNPAYDISESPADYPNPPPKHVIEKFDCNSVALNDLPTQQALKAADGFDISGCRYDNKNCAQNTTIYGAPLADCNAYDLNMAKQVGTIFYPLNA
jgi:hypothetical protein